MKKRGRVKFWSDRRGNGSITQDDGGPALYFHAATVLGCGHKNLMRGQFVEYEVGVNHVGPVAFSVRPLRPEEVTAAV